MKFLLTAAVAALAGSAAFGQGAQPAPAAPAMGDGVMTRAEVVATVREHFGRLDADKDGAISKAEVATGHEKMAAEMAGRAGAPHAMMRGDPNTAFDRLDSNKDGSISRDEFAKGREERVERRIAVREQGKDGKLGGMRGHRMGGMRGARMIVLADTDKDGRITLAEAEALALQHFDKMDSNRDGQVTREERRAGRRIMIEQNKAPNAS